MTPDRFNAIWRELRVLPIPHRMAMVQALLHEACLDAPATMIDAGMFDPVAGREVYVVAAIGPRADVLRMAVSGLARSSADGECRTIQLPRFGQPTPLCGRGGADGHD